MWAHNAMPRIRVHSFTHTDTETPLYECALHLQLVVWPVATVVHFVANDVSTFFIVSPNVVYCNRNRYRWFSNGFMEGLCVHEKDMRLCSNLYRSSPSFSTFNFPITWTMQWHTRRMKNGFPFLQRFQWTDVRSGNKPVCSFGDTFMMTFQFSSNAMWYWSILRLTYLHSFRWIVRYKNIFNSTHRIGSHMNVLRSVFRCVGINWNRFLDFEIHNFLSLFCFNFVNIFHSFLSHRLDNSSLRFPPNHNIHTTDRIIYRRPNFIENSKWNRKHSKKHISIDSHRLTADSSFNLN